MSSENTSPRDTSIMNVADMTGYDEHEIRWMLNRTPQERLEERVRELEARIADLERRLAATGDESGE